MNDTVRLLVFFALSILMRAAGPIIRMSPNTVHINDPDFIDQVFAGPGKKRDKGQQTINGLGGSPTALGSKKHDLHRSRRSAISPFFSKQNIRRLEPTIVSELHQIYKRLDQHLESGLPIDLKALFRAVTLDIISGYAFGDNPVNIGKPDLNKPYFDAYHQMVMTWHIGCYFPWIGHIMRKLPIAAVTMLMPTAKHGIDTIQASVLS